MSTTERFSCAETAKLLRQALKSNFPGIKFSVRSSTYSGGASIRVEWFDGPTKKEVEKVTTLYTGATFDGMQDLKTYHDTFLTNADGETRQVHFGADFIFTDRNYSPAFWWDAAKKTAAYWGFAFPSYGRPRVQTRSYAPFKGQPFCSGIEAPYTELVSSNFDPGADFNTMVYRMLETPERYFPNEEV